MSWKSCECVCAPGFNACLVSQAYDQKVRYM